MDNQEFRGKRNGGQSGKGGEPRERKSLDRTMDALLAAGFDQQNASTRVNWARDFILFHGKRHPKEMGPSEIYTYLGSQRFASPSGRADRVVAEDALKFLYEEVLNRRWLGNTTDLGSGPRQAKRAVYVNGLQPGVKLLDRIQNALRVGQYALDTEKTYVDWAKQFILFHGKRHPQEMGAMEVEQFLTYLAVKRQVSASTQKQALCALVFLYETVLGMKLGQLMPVRGRHGDRLPVVMSRIEVPQVLQRVEGAEGMYRLMCDAMYGSGLRVRECCRTRVKDLDFDRLQYGVRNGKGDHDRVTVLPKRLVAPLRQQIERVARLHEEDLGQGNGVAWLPAALRRKYPNAERELGWQYVFPSKGLSVDPRERDERIKRRHHAHVSSLEKAVKAAVRKSRLTKQITPHTFRHSFATHLLETGHNIKQVQELLGHKDIRTTMIYLHVMEGGTTNVLSPFDSLDL